MNKTELTTRIWYKVPINTLINELNIPNMAPEYFPEVCKLNPQKITGTMLSLVGRTIRDEDIRAIPIQAAFPTKKDDEYIECVVMLGGEAKEIEKLLALDLGFERLGNARELNQQAHKMRENAFYFMRKGNIRDFSNEELHRVFKHCKEKLLYTAIVRKALEEEGLTISSLFEQEHDRGMSR